MDDTEHDGGEDRWSFDPATESWWANILLYRPSMLSDDGMRIHFREFDGKWTEQTVNAMSRTAAKGLDLNSSWALTSARWTCPVCRREKPDLFRLSDNGCLLANLEVHHDHLPDTVWPRTAELLGRDWTKTAPSGTGGQVDNVERLIMRFRPTLVCNECNTADAIAKGALPAIDRRFSFAPDEIASFITASPGQPHSVDVSAAKRIWSEQKPKFERRVERIDDLVLAVADGTLGVNDSIGTGHLLERRLDPAEALHIDFRWQYERDARRKVLEDLRSEFITRSTSKDSPRLAGKALRPAVAISDDEFAAYADPVSPRQWEGVSEGWTCPCCDRSKREIVRKGNKGKWTGGIRGRTDLLIESDPTEIENHGLLLPSLAGDVVLREKVPVSICSDCAEGPTHVGHRFPEASGSHFNVADIREMLVSVAPHRQHEVDWDKGRKMAVANRALVQAERSFDAMLGQAAQFQAWMGEARRWGYPSAQVRERIARSLEFQIVDRDLSTMDRLIDWLLSRPIKGAE
ncbi:MAG: hypothetical protein WBA73_06725 [Devosia sp.]